MKIYLGADHNGYALKQRLLAYLQQQGYEVVDATHGKLNPEDDYPKAAGHTVLGLLGDDDRTSRAILICGSGQGVCIAANRYKGIRAAVCADEAAARAGRNDDDTNVLCLPARTIDANEAERIVNTWLQTPFAGAERFKRRIRELDRMN